MNAIKTRLTPEEAGNRLGVTRSQVAAFIRKGYLKATNVGDGTIRPRWQIHQDDLDDFIAHRDEIIPKKKRGGYHRKTKETPVQAEVKTVGEPISYLDQKYVTDLLQENRDLRKKLEETANKVLELVAELSVLKDSNAAALAHLEEERAAKEKMVEDIFGILANNE